MKMVSRRRGQGGTFVAQTNFLSDAGKPFGNIMKDDAIYGEGGESIAVQSYLPGSGLAQQKPFSVLREAVLDRSISSLHVAE